MENIMLDEKMKNIKLIGTNLYFPYLFKVYKLYKFTRGHVISEVKQRKCQTGGPLCSDSSIYMTMG